MSYSTNQDKIDLSQFKMGLIFDADNVSLFGKYEDELSAWRAKETWKEVLHDYFLLEPERDYEITIVSDLTTLTFCIKTEFSSACGRYAFWRLINHQAPEAEKKLGGSVASQNEFGLDLDNPKQNESWVINPLNEASNKNRESAKLLRKLLKIFQ